MLGRFLELSVYSRDVAASAAFWEGLGFSHGVVGDTWRHRYAVLSDGGLVLGLHEYPFDSPSLTWVRPGIAEAVAAFEALGIRFDFAKTGQDEFNEAGFRDPAGQVVTLLEARTWSAAFAEPAAPRLLGHFLEYRYPAHDPAVVAGFGETLGLVVDDRGEGPRAVAGGISLAPRAAAGSALLVFEHEDPAAAAARLAERGYPAERPADDLVLLRAPDGLAIRIEPARG
jgi:hypothetical protein